MWFGTLVRRLLGDKRGAVSAYMAIFGTIIIGGAALAVDLGRMTVLRSQLQNAADARAMAAAAQLDTLPGAMARATDIATNATAHASAYDEDGDFTVSSVNFYSAIDPALVAATGDDDAFFVEVTMQPANISFLFEPVLAFAAGQTAVRATTVGATAIATRSPFVCQVPPLAICDFGEDPTNPVHLRDPDNYGRMVQLKPPQAGSSFWAPGNFGLLEPPDGSGANKVEQNLAAVNADGCFAEVVTTEPGSKTNKVMDGINARFDMPGNPWPYPAPNVITYPRDTVMVGDASVKLGDGVWDFNGYWNDKHGGSDNSALTAGFAEPPTRFQTYLYEMGHSFGRSTIHPGQTYYPVTPEMPAHYTEITPPGEDIPTNPSDPDNPDEDGMPSETVASNGYERRLVQVAMLQCVSEGIKGSTEANTRGRYINVFVTEYAKTSPEAAIYGEVMGALSATTSDKMFSNVQLVR